MRAEGKEKGERERKDGSKFGFCLLSVPSLMMGNSPALRKLSPEASDFTVHSP